MFETGEVYSVMECLKRCGEKASTNCNGYCRVCHAERMREHRRRRRWVIESSRRLLRQAMRFVPADVAGEILGVLREL